MFGKRKGWQPSKIDLHSQANAYLADAIDIEARAAYVKTMTEYAQCVLAVDRLLNDALKLERQALT